MLGEEHTSEAAGSRDVRVDAAHVLRRHGAERSRTPAMHLAERGLAADDVGSVSDDADESAFLDAPPIDLDAVAASPVMLAEHAANLAGRLQTRLAEVDRRESRINSQEAEFDSRIRNARLWVEQCETDIAARQQQLDEREQQLTEREETAALRFERAEEIAQRLVELGEREKAADTLQLELELGRSELQTKLDAIDLETAACRSKQLELADAKQNFEQRQRDLDKREAALHNDQERISRQQAAINTGHADLERRAAQLAAAETALSETQRRLTEAASANEFRRAEIDRDAAELERRAAEATSTERRLQFRQREIESALKRFERLGIIEQKMVELEQQAASFEIRASYLDNAEAMLAERQMQWAEQQREFERQQLSFENHVSRERRALAAAGEQSKVECEQRQRELERRDKALDARQESLEQLAEQLRDAQRETLENRLATEETWLQLQGVLAPATLSRSIAQTRGRLAEQFELNKGEMLTRREELDRIRGELADQLAEVAQRRSEFQRWIDQHQAEIEQQAARLVAREQTLDEQDREMQRQQQRWLVERAEYQQQIQSLLAELRTPSRAAA
jgi:hypothetical protein